MTASDWRKLAACLGTDPDLFFPVGSEGPAAAQADEAKQVCRSCPVRRQCLDWALRHSQGYGVWGGMTQEERRASGIPVAPRVSALCDSGRHLKLAPGRCGGCAAEYQRERERPRERDYAEVYRRRAARRRAAKEVAA